MASMTHAYDWHGRTVVDRGGERVGEIDEVYEDGVSRAPEWALVHTGLFGSRLHMVPLVGAAPDGENVRVQVYKDQVHGAPSVAAGEELSEEQERKLFKHYGVRPAPRRSEPSGSAARQVGDAAALRQPGTRALSSERSNSAEDRRAAVGVARSSHRSADQSAAMVRSEEEVSIGIERRERERVRLRKYVVTEHVTKTVPLQKEVLRVEREPITENAREGSLESPALSEQEQELVLYEDQPVVEKRVVPKERVRLNTELVEEEREVSEEIRKERFETETAPRGPRGMRTRDGEA